MPFTHEFLAISPPGITRAGRSDGLAACIRLEEAVRNRPEEIRALFPKEVAFSTGQLLWLAPFSETSAYNAHPLRILYRPRPHTADCNPRVRAIATIDKQSLYWELMGRRLPKINIANFMSAKLIPVLFNRGIINVMIGTMAGASAHYSLGAARDEKYKSVVSSISLAGDFDFWGPTPDVFSPIPVKMPNGERTMVAFDDLGINPATAQRTWQAWHQVHEIFGQVYRGGIDELLGKGGLTGEAAEALKNKEVQRPHETVIALLTHGMGGQIEEVAELISQTVQARFFASIDNAPKETKEFWRALRCLAGGLEEMKSEAIRGTPEYCY